MLRLLPLCHGDAIRHLITISVVKRIRGLALVQHLARPQGHGSFQMRVTQPSQVYPVPRPLLLQCRDHAQLGACHAALLLLAQRLRRP